MADKVHWKLLNTNSVQFFFSTHLLRPSWGSLALPQGGVPHTLGTTGLVGSLAGKRFVKNQRLWASHLRCFKSLRLISFEVSNILTVSNNQYIWDYYKVRIQIHRPPILLSELLSVKATSTDESACPQFVHCHVDGFLGYWLVSSLNFV
jgi:hypothetical protein